MREREMIERPQSDDVVAAIPVVVARIAKELAVEPEPAEVTSAELAVERLGRAILAANRSMTGEAVAHIRAVRRWLRGRAAARVERWIGAEAERTSRAEAGRMIARCSHSPASRGTPPMMNIPTR